MGSEGYGSLSADGWEPGRGADAAVIFWKGFGVAAGLNGGHASNAAPGVDVNKIQFAVGPRYTRTVCTIRSSAASKRHMQLFGQSLFGGAHTFDGVFPDSSGATSSAGSFAFVTGAGLDLSLSKRLGLRLLEADYNRTGLPNNGSNSQDYLRFAFGVTWHIDKR